jgi:hypothetical protein
LLQPVRGMDGSESSAHEMYCMTLVQKRALRR